MVAPLLAAGSGPVAAAAGTAALPAAAGALSPIGMAAGGLSILTAIGQIDALQEAAEAEEEALRLRQSLKTTEAVRQARKTTRIARGRIAQIRNVAATSGVSGSSIESAGESTISSTIAGETGFIKTTNFLESQIVRQQLKASESQTSAALFSGARDLITGAGSLFG